MIDEPSFDSPALAARPLANSSEPSPGHSHDASTVSARVEYRETSKRSVIKAVSWRCLGTATTGVLVFAATHRLSLAATISVAEFSTKVVLFWLHERLWNASGFGRYVVKAGSR
ncbi:MAG: Adenylyl-sulfate kinase [Gemmatimonadetes bacterium]|nr:Adenylyl-sulfate kinase [Gemmatimonadota bacterium]